MRIFVIVLLLITPILCVGQDHSRPPTVSTPTTPSDNWINYTSPEGRYSVKLPGNPSLSTQESETADGVKFPQYMASVSSDSTFFMTIYFDKLAGNTFSLDVARQKMVEALKGTLINEASISLGGRPGREFLITGKGTDGSDLMIRARVYDFGTRIYLLQVIYAKATGGEVNIREGNKYFDSFASTTASP